MFKRRKNKRTDYKQRLSLLKAGAPRLVIRRSLNNTHLQIITFDEKGDKVLVEDSSKSLRKYGWLGHTGSIPAAYLTGLLVGLKAKRAGVNNAIVDIGLQISIKGSSLYAAATGMIDAGVKMPFGKEVVPDPSRINGSHISKYAAHLKKEDANKYKKVFSSYLKAGLEPEKVTENFEHTKSNIVKEFGIELKKAAVVKKASKSEDNE